MGIPQIIMIVLLGMDVGMHLVKHGEPRTDHFSFPIALISAILEIGLLMWGGFFG